MGECICGLGIVRGYKEKEYAIHFLRGLNETYNGVHSQILLMEPVPDINKVLSQLLQKERQWNPQIIEHKTLGNVIEFDNSGARRGRGTRRSMRGASNSTARRSIVGRGNSSKVCSFYGKVGHLVDSCYKKHGYPLHLKSKAANNYTIGDDLDDTSSLISQKEVDETIDLAFTLEQRRAILALI